MSKVNLSCAKKSFGIGAFFVLGAISLAFMGCGSTENAAKSSKKAPDWINGTSSAYPKSAYLTGTGSAKDKKSAEIDAINELASVFGQKITSATNSSRRMEEAQKAGVVANAESSSISQDILREVNQNDIIAVDIPEFYESQSEGKWYALAVMSREKGTQIYSGMIEKNQKEVSSIVKQFQAEKEPNTLLHFSRLDFAEEVAKVNEAYLKRLTILNPLVAKQYESIYSPAQIHKMKADMAVKIPICVNVDEDSDGRIAKAFQEAMASFGFNTTLGTNERYVISCKNHFTESENSNGKTKFCEYAAECALIDTFSGETLVPMSITGREGSPTYQNAMIRAKQKISSKAKGDFAQSFQKYLGDFKAF